MMPRAGNKAQGGDPGDKGGIIKVGFEPSVTRGGFGKVFPARNLRELRPDTERCSTPVGGHAETRRRLLRRPGELTDLL